MTAEVTLCLQTRVFINAQGADDTAPPTASLESRGPTAASAGAVTV
jgi:hypothetical protein